MSIPKKLVHITFLTPRIVFVDALGFQIMTIRCKTPCRILFLFQIYIGRILFINKRKYTYTYVIMSYILALTIKLNSAVSTVVDEAQNKVLGAEVAWLNAVVLKFRSPWSNNNFLLRKIHPMYFCLLHVGNGSIYAYLYENMKIKAEF